MQDLNLTIKENSRLTDKMWKMVLCHPDLEDQKPGQFINLKIEGYFLRRPISVCDAAPQEVTIIYAVVGKGTKALSEMTAGQKVQALCGLGNGYDTSLSGEKPLLLGGGAGVPPMYLLAKQLRSEGKPVTVILGFNTSSEVYYDEEFYKLGCRVILATAGQFSFEERMGCGFGACMGCSCKTITGYKRICKDGPVLRKEEILWED